MKGEIGIVEVSDDNFEGGEQLELDEDFVLERANGKIMFWKREYDKKYQRLVR